MSNVQVYNNKNIKLFYQDLVDISLKCGWCNSQSKKHYLVLEIAIAGFKSCFLILIFSNLYLIISIDEVKLDKTISLAELIQ